MKYFVALVSTLSILLVGFIVTSAVLGVEWRKINADTCPEPVACTRNSASGTASFSEFVSNGSPQTVHVSYDLHADVTSVALHLQPALDTHNLRVSAHNVTSTGADITLTRVPDVQLPGSLHLAATPASSTLPQVNYIQTVALGDGFAYVQPDVLGARWFYSVNGTTVADDQGVSIIGDIAWIPTITVVDGRPVILFAETTRVSVSVYAAADMYGSVFDTRSVPGVTRRNDPASTFIQTAQHDNACAVLYQADPSVPGDQLEYRVAVSTNAFLDVHTNTVITTVGPSLGTSYFASPATITVQSTTDALYVCVPLSDGVHNFCEIYFAQDIYNANEFGKRFIVPFDDNVLFASLQWEFSSYAPTGELVLLGIAATGLNKIFTSRDDFKVPAINQIVLSVDEVVNNRPFNVVFYTDNTNNNIDISGVNISNSPLTVRLVQQPAPLRNWTARDVIPRGVASISSGVWAVQEGLTLVSSYDNTSAGIVSTQLVGGLHEHTVEFICIEKQI